MLDDAFLRKLDAFSLAVREHTRGGVGGLRKSKALGSSVEFSDFRAYAPGDDLRRVDWNAFARFDKLFLKLFLDEQETTLRLLLDASASMFAVEPDKWALAVRLAATLAYLSLSRYDRVVVVTLRGGREKSSRAFAGRRSFDQVEKHLAAIRPSGETRLNEALAAVPVTPGRGVCVLLSDLLTGEGWSRGALSLLLKRQELSVLHILSRRELEPDLDGAVRLEDAEGGPSCDVRVSPNALLRYHEALTAFLLAQREFCHSRGIAYVQLASDMDLERNVLGSLTRGGVIRVNA
ncbi:MAG: DUF58 domain-containing protein [Firmicutes bacterium]|nr:DUF58 domain-containing protein [Bacillota bacterium]